MENTVAQQVKQILTNSGHNSRERVTRGILPRSETVKVAHRVTDEPDRPKNYDRVINEIESFTSDQDGEEAVVAYWGSVRREEERLGLYRLAIENSMLLVTEEGDPERQGRRRLRVVRP